MTSTYFCLERYNKITWVCARVGKSVIIKSRDDQYASQRIKEFIGAGI